MGRRFCLMVNIITLLEYFEHDHNNENITLFVKASIVHCNIIQIYANKENVSFPYPIQDTQKKLERWIFIK